MSLLAVIPARGGSKSIPRKNIKTLAGKPLIAWTIETALQTQGIDYVIVSTEDKEIASVAKKFGAQVPFLRPSLLAEDDTPGIAPVLHALEQLPGFDWVLFLQPTSPLRSVDDIEGIIQFCCIQGSPSAVSISEVSKHPFWMYNLDDHKRLQPLTPNRPEILQRQELPSAYVLNGALYLARTDWLREQGRFIGHGTLGYVMPAERSIDLDTPQDWDWAEYVIKRNHVK